MAIEYFKLDHGIAHVLLNRPERMNALDVASKAALGRIWQEIAADPSIHVVVLSGAGEKAFCVGSDIKEMQATGEMVDTDTLMNAIPDIGIRLDKPVIAALHGFTVGMGMTLALHSDLRIAARNTKIAWPETKHGVLSAVSAVNLAGVVGEAAALDLMLTARTIDAEEALKIGLVHRVVDGPVLAAALEWARALTKNSPLAMQLTKSLILTERRRRTTDHAGFIAQTRSDVARSEEFGDIVAKVPGAGRI